ncbi:hypothetical protein Barb4_04458 [Bacteroidales bacterium Barb4]|nr:hypothetical protein Barb4_04458 [Bacteroidales bacterium Barb4]
MLRKERGGMLRSLLCDKDYFRPLLTIRNCLKFSFDSVKYLVPVELWCRCGTEALKGQEISAPHGAQRNVGYRRVHTNKALKGRYKYR